jgi:lysophospholipid acyltransferase 1/2
MRSCCVVVFDWLVVCVRRVCYERCPYNPTAATFILSAMWHGAYPGYYLTFLTGIVVTLAARAVSTVSL